MAQNQTTRRLATLALALVASTGIGTAVAASSHAAINPAPHHTASTVAINATATDTSAYDFSTRVANVGEQAQIDACTGGLTKMVSVSNYVGKGYYPIHNECGGAPILNLTEGNTVHIEGLGDYTVVATEDVVRGDNASIIKSMPGDILLQTCHNTGNEMRVVALAELA